jgi:hypothetical protein
MAIILSFNYYCVKGRQYYSFFGVARVLNFISVSWGVIDWLLQLQIAFIENGIWKRRKRSRFLLADAATSSGGVVV